MQIVIDIPDKTYEYYVKLSNKSDEQLSAYERLILNGIPLPKGHGRLIDADALMKDVKKHYFDDHKAIRYVEIPLSVAPIVLEADNPCKDCRKVGEYCMTCEYE